VDVDYDLKRTHTCGELTLKNLDNEVILKGWVDRRRDLGGLIFVDLRDREGKTQVVFNPAQDSELHKKAEKIRNEYVLAVKGVVAKRLETNKKLATGEIEINAKDLRILNVANTPPLMINEEGAETEDVRLKYRFLDLRRPFMQQIIIFRHRVLQEIRYLLSAAGFIEIETPILMKSTPEGARDFLVPSRMNKGKFYALPQSPQTYKQLLMVAGFEKYFQIAKCFRDEDLRADRQPEFTQIDCEMSFITPEDIYETFGRFTKHLFKNVMNVEVDEIPRMTYQEAMERYGTDKPDLRFDMKIHDLTEILKKSGFKVFESVLEKKGVIKGILGSGCGDFTRNEVDQLTHFVVQYNAKGLIFLRGKAGKLEGSFAKFCTPEMQSQLKAEFNAQDNDMIFIIAADAKTVNTALGQLRLEIAQRKNILKKGMFKFVWVTDFPMFEYSETEKQWTPSHHPFTAPLDEDIGLLYGPEYFLARAKAYDFVLNGNEIAGGSIRIYNSGLQSKIFELLKISEEEAQKKFGFLMGAFKYGAPPHGGIAFGLDRMIMLMQGLDSIRDVIPFPKTTTGASLMDDAPSEASNEQLNELGIKLKRS
jgi:aspartyl-tRNA synthetase